MGDALYDLPVDFHENTSEETRLLEQLSSHGNAGQKQDDLQKTRIEDIERSFAEKKDSSSKTSIFKITIIVILFVVLSLPYTDKIINSIYPGSKSVTLAIKTLMFVVLLYVFLTVSRSIEV